MHTRRNILPLLALAAAPALCADAELFGIVRDQLHLPVPGAAVELRNIDTGAARRATTDERGGYHLLGLPAGAYRIRVDKDGFRTLLRDLTLELGARLALDFVLEVGDLPGAVEVRAAAPLLNTTRGGTGFVLEQRKISSLPLDGRNFVPLLALLPGVTLPPGSVLPRINGSRPRVSEYVYDGISVLQPEPGQVAFYPIIDAIDEFRVETNSYSAEYGRSNGGVILVRQKSGTNELHGTLFEFFRNEALNARNLFARPGPKPRFRRNQYGFVLGGPVQRNRAFFLAGWQGTRLQNGVVRTSTVPSVAERAGQFAGPVFDPATTRRDAAGWRRDPFPGNLVPPARQDPAALAVVDRYPRPDSGAAANNYRRAANDIAGQDQFDLRLDRYLGARHRFFARYTHLRDHSRPATPLPDGSGALTSGVIGDTLTRAAGMAAEHTWTISAASVNQARFGYTRRSFARGALRTGRSASAVSGIPGIPVSAFGDALPIYNVVGYQQLGPPSNGNAEFATSVTQFFDMLSQVRGGHSLKLGSDLRLEHLDALQPPNPTGQFQFTPILTGGLAASGTPLPGTGNSFASFLLGQVQNFTLDVQREVLQPRARIAEFFVQDDWRASGRLSLNLGLRYTLNFPSTEAHDQAAVFNLATQKLDFLGRNGVPRAARKLEKTNFGPRLGLAYKAAESLVVRAGYGLTWIEQAGITTPFTTPLFPFVRTVGQRSLDNIHPAFVLSAGPSLEVGEPGPDSGLGQGVFAVQRDQKSGYAQQWNVTFEKTFGEHWSAQAGYVGSKLTNLGVPDVNLNQLGVEQLALGPALAETVANPYFGDVPASSSLGGPVIARQQLLRPFPRFTTVSLYRNNVGNSTFHSFQARLEKRFWRNLTLSGSYTFSKLIDDAGAVFDAAILTGPVAAFQAADSFNRRLEKSISTGDIRHALAAGFVIELPAGWRLAGIARAQSGSPVAVIQATNFNAFAGFGIQRPDRLGDPQWPAGQRTTARYFNTAAFAEAPQFRLGNSSRNPVTGPGYRTLDLMAGKTFRLSERWRTEFRAEAFNLTNTPPLGNPDGRFGTPAFGTITSALDPRVFEMVMKVRF